VKAKKASVWKRGGGSGTGWNTLALCVSYHSVLSFIGFGLLLHDRSPACA